MGLTLHAQYKLIKWDLDLPFSETVAHYMPIHIHFVYGNLSVI